MAARSGSLSGPSAPGPAGAAPACSGASVTPSGAAGSADLNGDGVVDGADLAILLNVFGPVL